MANFNVGIRFNDLMAKYMFLEFDSDTGTCELHLESDDHGATMRMKATISPDMWETEDDPGDGPGED